MRKITAIATIVFLLTFLLDNLDCFTWIRALGPITTTAPSDELISEPEHPTLLGLYHFYFFWFPFLVFLLNVACLFGRERPVAGGAAPAKISAAKIVGCAGMFALFSLIFGSCEYLFFVDIPSFVAVVGVTYFALLLTYGSRAHSFIRHSLQAFFRKGVPPCPEFRDMTKWGGIYALASGLLVCLIGMEQLLYNISGPDLETFIRGLSVSLIPVLYGGLFNLFIFMPLNRLWAGQEVEAPLNFKGSAP